MEHNHSAKLMEIERQRTLNRERFIRINSQFENEATRIAEAKKQALELLGTDNVDEINVRIQQLENSITQRMAAMENQNTFFDTILSALENGQPLNAEQQKRLVQYEMQANGQNTPELNAESGLAATAGTEGHQATETKPAQVTEQSARVIQASNPLAVLVSETVEDDRSSNSVAKEAPVVVDATNVVTLDQGSPTNDVSQAVNVLKKTTASFF